MTEEIGEGAGVTGAVGVGDPQRGAGGTPFDGEQRAVTVRDDQAAAQGSALDRLVTTLVVAAREPEEHPRDEVHERGLARLVGAVDHDETRGEVFDLFLVEVAEPVDEPARDLHA